jgi:hypothetical protein
LSLRDLHGNNFESEFQSSMELVKLAFPSCSRHEINSSLSSTNLAALSAGATRIIYFDEMRRLMHVIKDTSSINKTVAHIPLALLLHGCRANSRMLFHTYTLLLMSKAAEHIRNSISALTHAVSHLNSMCTS